MLVSANTKKHIQGGKENEFRHQAFRHKSSNKERRSS